MSIGKISEFDVDSGNWRTYCDRLKMYFMVNNLKPEFHVPTLIATVGDKAYELIVNLTSPKEPSSLKFNEIEEIVGNHLQPKPSEMAERYKFRQRRQREGETIASYVAELKRLSRFCEFKQSLEDNMRDQLVCGLANDIIRQRLFAETELTYSKAISLATALEAAERNSAEVEKPLAITTKLQEDLHGLSLNRASRSSDQYQARGDCCACCGSVYHLIKDCRFRSYECSSCRRKGHLQRMCPDKGRNKLNSHKYTNRGNRKERSRHTKSSQHYTELEEKNEAEESSSDEEEIYQMSLKNYPAVSIPIRINNIELIMEVDTGSALSCISKRTYCNFFKQLPLESCSVTLRFYDGSKISPVGLIKPTVQYLNCTKQLDLYVIDGGTTSLLGRQWLSELGVQLPLFNNNCIKELKSDSCNNINVLLGRYKQLFDGHLGKYTGGRATLHVREGARPVFCRARPLPYALREQVDQELDNMLRNGTIEPVEFSEWATPLVVVSKPNGKLRICADYKVTLNPSLLVDRYPLPRVDELFAELNGGVQFSKIDLSSAYNQIELDESKKYTVINTHRGLFRYNRLVYGLAIFQRIMTSIMQNIPGVSVFMDDLLISAKDTSTHMKILETVFERLHKNGLRLNKSKCIFFADSVAYLGYVIDKNGIHTDPDKIKAIMGLPRPSNVSELRSFLGMVNFYAKFIKNLSSHLAPLYSLLKKSSCWKWSKQCEEAFFLIKKLLTSTCVLSHYDQDKPLIVTCDASARGVGAVLAQQTASGTTAVGERPISYASRALTPAEQQYSQIQREALAIILAVKKFHQYLYGRKFILRTDHKPLVTIFGPKAGVPCMAASRLQRWAIILSAYNFDIEYISTNKNNADALSRLPLNENNIAEKECLPEQTYLHFARDALLFDYKKVCYETKKDSILGRVLSYVQGGWLWQLWPAEVEIKQLQPYFNRRNEIYLELGCLMWGHRVIIPEKCRDSILRELHETHLGIVKMKSLARSYVWWAGLDEQIEALCRACHTCAALAPAPPAHAPRPWSWCPQPWRRLHMDFLGPINNFKFLVIVDSTSKWTEVFKMTTTNAFEVIRILRRLFAQFGLPRVVVSDNGPPFTSDTLKKFFEGNGIEQCFSAPYHPSSNGAAENAVKLCKSVINKALKDNIDVETALHRYLLLYRNTQHSATGDSPARILQNRNLRTRLDAFKPDRNNMVMKAQQRQLEKVGGAQRDFQSGEHVLIRNFRDNQKWLPGEVLEKLGSTNYRVRDSTGRQAHRHIDQLKRRSRSSLTAPSSYPIASRDSKEDETDSVVPLDDTTNSAISSGRTRAADTDHENTVQAEPAPFSPVPPPKTDESTPKRIRYPVKRYGLEID